MFDQYQAWLAIALLVAVLIGYAIVRDDSDEVRCMICREVAPKHDPHCPNDAFTGMR